MADRNSNMGRPSLFRDKKGGRRIQALITRRACERFEEHRIDLATLARRPRAKISDADVVEYLVIGKVAMREHLARAV